MQDKVDDLIRIIFEGTAEHTGPPFFEALVRSLSSALGIAGAWVTEFDPQRRRMRALAFWFQDHYIAGYEYALQGTPCEPVIDRCTLFHVPENVIDLYPGDPDLPPLKAVSYLGMPLVDQQGEVFGHLAALDVKPLTLTPRIEALFKVFAARAGAEIQRLRAEAALAEREQELSTLLDGASDAILALDAGGCIRQVNRALSKLCSRGAEELIGLEFAGLLTSAGEETWRAHFDRARSSPAPRRLWIGDLELTSRNDQCIHAEATLSEFERRGERFWTLIMRDLNERLEAERQMAALRNESEYLRTELARPASMIGDSPAMRELFSQISQVAPTQATVLIHGETGTGKELVARAIHEAGGRASHPMIRVNCAAIPATLMESEFFGHERGAFTGAAQRREGRFALADGGTLFLDEVGELPLDLQPKLLRVLQEGEFEPVGSSRSRKVDVRVIAATNRDLRREAEQGRFRLDLYYRLNVFPLWVPPLRERGRDIVLLAAAFLDRLGQKLGRAFRPLSPQAVNLLLSYDWPGNVRELENILERAAILSRGGEIRVDTLLSPLKPAPPDPAAPPSILTAEQLLALERENIVHALEAAKGKVSGPGGAAELLGLPPSTVNSRIKALRIRSPHQKSPNK